MIKRIHAEIRQQVPPEPEQIPVSKFHWTWSLPSKPVKTLSDTLTSNIVNSVSPSQGTAGLPNPPPYPGTDNTWSQVPSNQQLDIQKLAFGLSRPLAESVSSQVVSTPPIATMASAEFHPQETRPPANPLLATLLDVGSPAPAIETPTQSVVSESPMLSKLLEENTSVAVTSNPFPTPNPGPRKRLGKRKSSKDMMAGKSPKHRVSETDVSERTSERVNSERHGQGMGEKHIDLDSSGGSYEEPVRPSSVSSVSSIGGQSTGSVIDLTEIGESHVKKLENSLDSFIGKESPHSGGLLGLNSQLNIDSLDINLGFPDLHHNQNSGPGLLSDPGGDFQQPSLQWPSRQTPPTPTSRNSPHHGVLPKNEKTSTSLEELLQGPRGRENEGPNSVHVRRNSQQQRRQSFKRQSSTGRNSVESSSGGVSPSPDVFSPLITSPSHNPLASPVQLPISSPLSSVSPSSSLTMISPSHQPNVISPIMQAHMKTEPSNHDSKSGIFGSHLPSSTNVVTSQTKSVVGHITSAGKPSLSLLKAQLRMENDVNCFSAISQEKDCVSVKDEHSNASSASSTSSQPPLMKLKLTNMRQFDSVSPSDGEESKSRSSTFDFHSDDDDEFALPKVDHMTVVSASPTRLQISNKTTLASFNKFNKSEKFKRKQRERELKQALSVDSGKRKRDKDESKKDKKKKKLNSYSVDKEMPVYKSTTVDVECGNENDHKRMPKLKITKSGVKISMENSVLQVKDVKTVDKNEKLLHGKDAKSTEREDKLVNKLEKEAVVKIEKVEKSFSKKLEIGKDVNSVLEMKSEKKKEKTAEGIFEKINAMKTENTKSEDSNSSVEKKVEKESASISQKKINKKLHKRSNSASKSDSKISKTPTIKLAPIKLPTSSSSSVTVSRTATPTTPLTPKSVTQSPTSTTIGKIGAVSLATSGSQKQVSNSTSKSPQGSATGKSTLASRSLSTGGSAGSSKMNSNLQKNFQIQGPSGKNSPVPSAAKSGHSRSSSVSNLSLSGSKQEKALSKSFSASTRTASPSLEKEKSKSSSGSSRSSSGSGREREKSTSAGKSSVPSTTVNTQDVLSFLNPKEIPKFTIPKLSSSTSTQKVSTPTSVNSPTIVSTCSSTSVTTTTTNSSAKFSKGSSQPVTQVSKGSNSGNVSASTKTNLSNNSNHANPKNNSFNKGSGNFQTNNSTRSTNQSVSNALNSNRGSNSPNSFAQKGGNSAYNKGGNQNSSNQSSGFRNFNHTNSKPSNPSNSPNVNSNWNNSGNTFSKGNHSINHTNQNSYRGSSSGNFSGSSKLGNSTGNSEGAVNSGNRTVSSASSIATTNSRAVTNTASNGPKGPGPPSSGNQQENRRQGSVGQAQPGVRGRKGSLSAVIDKLTCKASGPSGSGASSTNTASVTKNVMQKLDQVIVNESPASPEMDAPVEIPAKQENKVVISEAPASPEPETPTSASLQNNRLSSASEIVSIPLENKPCQSSVNADFSKDRTSSSVLGTESKAIFSSPKNIPLDTPPKDKQNYAKTLTQGVKNKNNCKQSDSQTLTPVSQQNGDIDGFHSKHGNETSNHNSDLVNAPRAKDSVFKVPTPKRQESLDKSLEETDGVNGKRKSRSDSKTQSDLSSPASSPENGLIIDFSPSSLTCQNKTSSPQSISENSSENATENCASTKCIKSPSIKPAVNTAKHRTSPSCSPVKDMSNLGSNPSSPNYADDDLDLMDEALGLGN